MTVLQKWGWPDTKGGINDSSVGSYFGVNDDAKDARVFDITELWFEQALWNNTLLLRIGKIDLTGDFECHGCPSHLTPAAMPTTK